MAAVKTGGKWGYIDKTGKVVVEIKYDDAKDFSEGLAAVWKGGRYFYIDKTGKKAIKSTFANAESFSNGLAEVNWTIVGDDTKDVGYIDKTGKIIWKGKAIRVD